MDPQGSGLRKLRLSPTDALCVDGSVRVHESTHRPQVTRQLSASQGEGWVRRRRLTLRNQAFTSDVVLRYEPYLGSGKMFPPETVPRGGGGRVIVSPNGTHRNLCSSAAFTLTPSRSKLFVCFTVRWRIFTEGGGGSTKFSRVSQH